MRVTVIVTLPALSPTEKAALLNCTVPGGGGTTPFTTVTLLDALRVMPPVVKLAPTFTVVSLATSPALSRPKLEMLVAAESLLHVGFTPCDEPSLNVAVAVYCAVLFSFNELGPLMLRAVSVGGTNKLTMVTLWFAERVTPARVTLADTVTTESALTSPALNWPDDEPILAPAPFTPQVGDADCEEPSLKMAVAVNCAELFSLIEPGPLMAR